MTLNFQSWEDMPTENCEVKWIIPDLLEEDSMSAIVGPPGSGKSFLTTDLAASVATGTPWLGVPHFTPTKKCRVAYITPEGKNSTVTRLREQFLSRGKYPNPHSFFVSSGTLSTATSENYAELCNFDPDVIFIDTWARATPGVDENSASRVGKIINELDELREETGCSIVIVHHSTLEGSRMRGTSALFGAVDTQLLVSVDNVINSQFSVTVNKQKNAPVWANPLPFPITQSPHVSECGHPILSYPQ